MRDCFHEGETQQPVARRGRNQQRHLRRLCLSRENYAVLTGSAEERAESDFESANLIVEKISCV